MWFGVVEVGGFVVWGFRGSGTWSSRLGASGMGYKVLMVGCFAFGVTRFEVVEVRGRWFAVWGSWYGDFGYVGCCSGFRARVLELSVSGYLFGV